MFIWHQTLERFCLHFLAVFGPVWLQICPGNWRRSPRIWGQICPTNGSKRSTRKQEIANKHVRKEQKKTFNDFLKSFKESLLDFLFPLRKTCKKQIKKKINKMALEVEGSCPGRGYSKRRNIRGGHNFRHGRGSWWWFWWSWLWFPRVARDLVLASGN